MNTLTSLQLFCPDDMSQQEQKTIICFGTPRGGTSMVAGTLLGLGIFMGENLKVNIEDPIFNIDGDKRPLPEIVTHLEESIEDRNANHAVWGWKYPRAAIYLNQIIEKLVNPHFVIVFRDPVPGTIRAMPKNPENRENLDGIFKKHVMSRLHSEIANMKLAMSHEVPTLLVSYEKASIQPEAFLSELAAFTGSLVPEDTSRILEFMRPGAYKNPSMLQTSA